MILSFLFFVTFIFFLFAILKPYDAQTLTGAVITGIFDSFEEATRTNLTNIFLKANYSNENPLGDATCFFVQLPNEIFAYAFTDSIVTGVNDIKINSEIKNGEDINIGDVTEVFYKVSISPDFNNDSLLGCENITDYELGSVIERGVVSYKSLENMNNSYYSGNYSNLKSSLRIPRTFDFAIVSDNLPLNMEREIPSSLEVVAKEYVMEVLHDNGTIVNTKFTLKVW
jgi:hypothetical protein